MQWPVRSSDLNSIEDLLGILVRAAYTNRPRFRTTKVLENAIFKVLQSIDYRVLKM